MISLIKRLMIITLSVTIISMYIATYISMWDYPNIALVSSIWGGFALIGTTILLTQEKEGEDKNG